MRNLIPATLAIAGLALAATALGAPAPKTLHNSGDPTLTLTPGLRGAASAPPGTPAGNPDPHDFNGVWWLAGYEYLLGPEPGVEPPLKPEYMRILERRIRAKNRGTPEADASTQCFPHGMPRVMESPYPIEIVQTPERITFLHEVAHNLRRIWLNRDHPKKVAPTYLGDSVGHWEGDTLIVDTIGLNDKTFIDDEGSSHSTQEHVVERFRKIDNGSNLELIMTVEDPVTLEHSYSYRRIYHWRPDVRPQEYVCEENNRNAPVNGVTVAQMRQLRVFLSVAALSAVSVNVMATPPDLSGVWFISAHVGALKSIDGKAPPLTAEAKTVYAAHKAAIAKGDYSFDGLTSCLPPGLPRLMLMHEPFEILQRPKVLYFVHQLNRLPRRVYLDEALPTDVDPHYLGYSVAKWDGDALVVDTNGFDDSTMLDNEGMPHSDALHLTERYQLSPDGMHLHLLMTIEDPKTFTKAWSAQADYTKRPGYELTEEVCAATPETKRPRS